MTTAEPTSYRSNMPYFTGSVSVRIPVPQFKIRVGGFSLYADRFTVRNLLCLAC